MSPDQRTALDKFPRNARSSSVIPALSMLELAPLVTDAQVASLDAGVKPRRAGAGTLPAAGTLVADCYGRRDWVLRRLPAVSDAERL